MTRPYFFGYGSLVNCATHTYPDAQHAVLCGWRRTWKQTALRPVAFLTATPDPNTEIEGLIAHVPGNDWRKLDEREWAYDRVPATSQTRHNLDHLAEIAVYAVPEHAQANASDTHPILLSYLDVVVQGYLREFGATGAARFFETTSGWEAPILNDRSDPRYPRSQRLSARETDFVDLALADLSATIKQLDKP